MTDRDKDKKYIQETLEKWKPSKGKMAIYYLGKFLLCIFVVSIFLKLAYKFFNW